MAKKVFSIGIPDDVQVEEIQIDPTVGGGLLRREGWLAYSTLTQLLYLKTATAWEVLEVGAALAAIATSGSASDLIAGSIPADRFGMATIPASALDSTNVLPSAGSNLTNADLTINPATDRASVYTLPGPTTLTGSHTLTIGVTGSPSTNLVVQIIRRDTTVNTYTVKDDAGTTLITLAAGNGASFYFNGTHFALLSIYYVA